MEEYIKMWMIVGLGNPGKEYARTRHNVGFEVMDELGRRGNFAIRKIKHRALTQTAEIGGQRVLVMKPTTFMNLSGEAIIDAAKFYKVPAERVLVVCDDVSLPTGKLRLRRSGSAEMRYSMPIWVNVMASLPFFLAVEPPEIFRKDVPPISRTIIPNASCEKKRNVARTTILFVFYSGSGIVAPSEHKRM
jgi:hypothetical protein